jgi:hypothetical protein
MELSLGLHTVKKRI